MRRTAQVVHFTIRWREAIEISEDVLPKDDMPFQWTAVDYAEPLLAERQLIVEIAITRVEQPSPQRVGQTAPKPILDPLEIRCYGAPVRLEHGPLIEQPLTPSPKDTSEKRAHGGLGV